MKKQQQSIMPVLFMVLASLASYGQNVGDRFTVGNIRYEITCTTEVEIVDYTVTGGTVIIPSTVDHGQDTYTVTSIGAHAFRDNQLQGHLVIPNSITSIGHTAFMSNQLTRVTLSENLTSIPGHVFRENQLTEVTIPDGVTSIGTSTFSANQLTSVTISKNVTTIGTHAFHNNSLNTVFVRAINPPSILGTSFLNRSQINVVVPRGDLDDNTKTTYEAHPQWTIFNDITEGILVSINTPTFRDNLASFPINITFGEDVTGFTEGDIHVDNANVVDGSFSPVDGSLSAYTVELAPIAGGTITVDIPGNVAQYTSVPNLPASTTITVNTSLLVSALTLTPGPPVCADDDAIFTIAGGNQGDEVTYEDGTPPGKTVTLGADGSIEVAVRGVSSNTTLTLTNITRGDCSIPLTRTTATVMVNARPEAPSVNSASVEYCQGDQAGALTATGDNLRWYTSQAGGTGETTAPIPGTANTGSTTHYVSQTINGCESDRTPIEVTVNAPPQAPTISSTNSPICAGDNAIFTITGGNQGDEVTYDDGTSTSPQMVTLGAGGSVQVTVRDVSSNTTLTLTNITRGNCSTPLTTNTTTTTTATVTVNARPEAPSVNSASVEYCQGDHAGALTATGDNLRWYTSETGGTGETTAPIPGTADAGSTTHYVSQTTNGCESDRTQIEVTVKARPEAPTISSTNSPICAGDNAIFTIQGGNQGDVVTYEDGTPPSKTVTLEEGGSVQVTVREVSSNTTLTLTNITRGDCSTPLTTTTATVMVNARPEAPSVNSSSVEYCLEDEASALTATGDNLRWYTSETGGTGETTAPIPSTANAGSTTHYVSQTINGCESDRRAIEVTVNARPEALTISSTNSSICAGNNAIFTIQGGNQGDVVTYEDGTPPNKTVTLEEGGSIQVTVSGVSPEVTLKEVTRGNCSTPLTATARVTVNANPPTLTLTPGPPVCAGDIAIFTIEGGNKDDVVIYDDGTSTRTVTIRADGKATVPVNGVSSNTTLTLKEVSNENCSIELSKMATVTVNDLPVAPTVSSSPVEYCVDETATALTATGDNLLWYTSETGGTGEATAPIPGTAIAGSTTHYVSQTTNGCESERAEIVVTVVEACLVQIGDMFTVSGIDYEITSVNPNEVKVMDYIGSATAVEIPAAVDDKDETYAVTAIGANAFSDNPDLSTVKIEADHLLSIHADAFADRSQVDLVVPIGMRQAYIDEGLTGFASITEEQVVTAIHNYEFKDFTLYPNPARDKVYIDLGPGQALKQVNIYTMDRAYLHSENGPVINTARLPRGTYLFEIVTKTGDRSTRRVILQ